MRRSVNKEYGQGFYLKFDLFHREVAFLRLEVQKAQGTAFLADETQGGGFALTLCEYGHA